MALPNFPLKPEYLHILINPVPVYGLGLGAGLLLFALLLKSKQACATAILLIFIGASSAWPVVEIGETAYDRTQTVADTDGGAWLEEHEHRGKQSLPFFLALAGVAALAFIAQFNSRKLVTFNKFAVPLALITLVGALAMFGVSGYVAYAGGKVMHKELREKNKAPPVRPEEAHGKDAD